MAGSGGREMIVTILGGAGFMGAGIVRDMLSARTIISIESIRLCDAAMEKLQDLTAELADPRLIGGNLAHCPKSRKAAPAGGVPSSGLTPNISGRVCAAWHGRMTGTASWP